MAELEEAAADDFPETARAGAGAFGELLRITGGITMGRPESDGIRGMKRSADEHDLEIEILDPSEIRKRWPQFEPRDNMIGAYDSRSGVLFPEKCVSAHLDQASKEGADLHYNEPVRSWRPDGDGVRVFTDHGEFTADQIVFSAGAWNPGFVSKLNLPFRLERQVLFWFQPAGSPEISGLKTARTTRVMDSWPESLLPTRFRPAGRKDGVSSRRRDVRRSQ